MHKILLLYILFYVNLFSQITPLAFNNYFSDNKNIMLFIDPSNGKIIHANNAARDFYGYANLTDMNIQQINTFTNEQVIKEMENAKNTKRNYFIFNHILADGSVKKVRVYSELIVYNKKKVLYSTIYPLILEKEFIENFNTTLEEQVKLQSEDLHREHKKTTTLLTISLGISLFSILVLFFLHKYRSKYQNTLKSQKEEFQMLFNFAPVAMALSDKSGNIIERNNNFIDLFGYTQEDVPNIETWFIKAYPNEKYRKEVQNVWNEKIKNSSSDNLIGPLEVTVTSKNKKNLEIQIISLEFMNGLITVFIDYSEKNKLINELFESKNFSDSILQNSAHAIITTDTQGIITLFNKKAEQLLGYQSSELVNKKTPAIFHKKQEVFKRAKEFSTLLHKEIKPGFETFIAKTTAGLKNNNEWIYISKDKKEFTVSLNITSLTDIKNNCTGYIGIAEDISEAKEKERKIQEYVNLIDKNIIISSTDLFGNITYVSEAFCKISGYTKDEILSKNHRIIRHPDMDDSTFKNMYITLKKNKIWKGEIKNIAKDGSFFWVYTSISPTFNDLGDKVGYTAIRQDITDKKIIEKISITDGLTNIYNRRHFNELFPRIINSAKRKNELISFLMMDIDHFKQYNDTYGHQSGDNVLKKIAGSLKDTLHRSEDYCFRLGGEEFGIIFKVDSKEKALEFANSIRENIENLHILHSKNSASSYITMSIGIVCKNANDIKNVDEIYKQSDDLLYRAKEAGRNKVYI